MCIINYLLNKFSRSPEKHLISKVTIGFSGILHFPVLPSSETHIYSCITAIQKKNKLFIYSPTVESLTTSSNRAEDESVEWMGLNRGELGAGFGGRLCGTAGAHHFSLGATERRHWQSDAPSLSLLMTPPFSIIIHIIRKLGDRRYLL